MTISFNLPPGVALGDAVAQTEALKQRLGVPSTISTTFSGTAQTFQQSLANQGILLAAAVLTIYMVLGMLYESYIHPLTILTGLPSAVVGALGALVLFGMDLSVIAMIGLLMLIGIVKKNAIMMIDVALDLQRMQHMPPDRGDLQGRDPALSSDHDDDLRRDPRHAADRDRPRREFGIAPAARHRGGRRAGGVAIPDAVHHAGAVSLHGPAGECGKQIARRG